MPQLKKPNRFFMGIDVGMKGGAAILDSNGKITTKTCKKTLAQVPAVIRFSKYTEEEIAKWFDIEVPLLNSGLAIAVERVWARPANGSRHAFGQGRYCGFIIGVLAANDLRLRCHDPTAQAWQQHLAISSRKYTGKGKTKKWLETYSQFKDRLHSIAKERFAKQVDLVHKELADALLIAEYCRLIEQGK